MLKLPFLSVFRAKFSPVTAGLLIFTLCNVVLLNRVLSVPQWARPLSYTVYFFKFFESSDSWSPMESAYDYSQQESRGPLYSEIFFTRKIKFQYPPSSLLIFHAAELASLPLDLIIKWVSWISVVTTVLFSLAIYNTSLTSSIPDGTMVYPSQLDLVLRNLLLLLLGLTFYPVIKSYTLGQIQTWLNAIFTILFLCWMKGKKALSGTLLGIMCLIKPQYSLVFVWGLLRRQWTFLLAFFVTLSLGLLASVSVFGIEDHIGYMETLSYISKHGEAFFPNQSVNGVLNRLLFNGRALVFSSDFAPFNSVVYCGTLISSTILILAAFFWPTKKQERGSIVDFAVVMLSCTMASPIAWQHHYGILLPIFALLFAYLGQRRIFGRKTVTYLCASYVLAANFFTCTGKFAEVPILNVVLSYRFAGALLVLIALYVLRSAGIRFGCRIREEVQE